MRNYKHLLFAFAGLVGAGAISYAQSSKNGDLEKEETEIEQDKPISGKDVVMYVLLLLLLFFSFHQFWKFFFNK